jgi:(S)-ureidoglycine aminohydrolase
MQSLGHSRSSREIDHALLTPDTFIRAPLPGMKDATAIVHAAPAGGASFTQYTAEFQPGGCLGPPRSQRFLYVIDGELRIEMPGQKHRLMKNGFAYFPAGEEHCICAVPASRAAIIEKDYQPLDSVRAPQLVIGDENSVEAEPLMGDESLRVRMLLPAGNEFDMAVNTITFEPGASLPMVESHVMEHGLVMLEGGGIYRLGQKWYPVTAGDFIWMAPYCPQWFGAIGKIPARYLLYKDWNRDPS